MTPILRNFASLAAVAASLQGCAAYDQASWSPAQPVRATPATQKLLALPPAGQRVAIAVYNFSDQTGQFKPTDGVQTLSRAVTQGATSILIKALQEVGNNGWFTVIERERLDNVLRERAVIREMRSSYLGEKTINPQALPPLLFAGILLEGGVIGYDSNTKTGGLGARFLGIGGDVKYREDTVTVYLRAVSVKTGEVLTNVSVRKTIASFGAGGSAFRYVAFKELLEVETGFSFNEPDALALQHAIEEAVYGLVLEGAMQDLWCLSSTEEISASLIRSYIARRDGIDERNVAMPRQADGSLRSGACTARNSAQRRQAPAVSAAPAAAQQPQPQLPPATGQTAAPASASPLAAQAVRPAPAPATAPAAAVPAGRSASGAGARPATQAPLAPPVRSFAERPATELPKPAFGLPRPAAAEPAPAAAAPETTQASPPVPKVQPSSANPLETPVFSVVPATVTVQSRPSPPEAGSLPEPAFGGALAAQAAEPAVRAAAIEPPAAVSYVAIPVVQRIADGTPATPAALRAFAPPHAQAWADPAQLYVSIPVVQPVPAIAATAPFAISASTTGTLDRASIAGFKTGGNMISSGARRR